MAITNPAYSSAHGAAPAFAQHAAPAEPYSKMAALLSQARTAFNEFKTQMQAAPQNTMRIQELGNALIKKIDELKTLFTTQCQERNPNLSTKLTELLTEWGPYSASFVGNRYIPTLSAAELLQDMPHGDLRYIDAILADRKAKFLSDEQLTMPARFGGMSFLQTLASLSYKATQTPGIEPIQISNENKAFYDLLDQLASASRISKKILCTPLQLDDSQHPNSTNKISIPLFRLMHHHDLLSHVPLTLLSQKIQVNGEETPFTFLEACPGLFEAIEAYQIRRIEDQKSAQSASEDAPNELSSDAESTILTGIVATYESRPTKDGGVESNVRFSYAASEAGKLARTTLERLSFENFSSDFLNKGVNVSNGSGRSISAVWFNILRQLSPTSSFSPQTLMHRAAPGGTQRTAAPFSFGAYDPKLYSSSTLSSAIQQRDARSSRLESAISVVLQARDNEKANVDRYSVGAVPEARRASPPDNVIASQYVSYAKSRCGIEIVAARGVSADTVKRTAYVVDMMFNTSPTIVAQMQARGFKVALTSDKVFSAPEVPPYSEQKPGVIYAGKELSKHGEFGTTSVIGFMGESVHGSVDYLIGLVVHEVAHAVQDALVHSPDGESWQKRFTDLYDKSPLRAAGVYASTNNWELFAVMAVSYLGWGVLEDESANNGIGSRAQLLSSDPAMYQFMHEIFGDSDVGGTSGVFSLLDTADGDLRREVGLVLAREATPKPAPGDSPLRKHILSILSA